MIRYIVVWALLYVALFGDAQSKLLKQFQAKKYGYVCTKGMKLFYSGHKEEMFVSLVASACAQSDNMNPLGLLQAKMVNSTTAREKASEYLALLLQKRLLYQYMIDDIELSEYSFAYSNHILSLIFSHLKSGDFTLVSAKPKMIKFKEANKMVVISVSDDEPKRVYVDEYVDDTLKKRHWYQ